MTIAPVVTETQYALTAANLGPFSTVWPYEQDSDVKVALDLGAGLQTLANGVGYTLTDAGTGTEQGGGTITLSNTLLVNGAWPATSMLYIWRAVGGGQPSTFGEMGQFSPQSSEQALDHAARQIQELKTLANRTLAGRPGETINILPSAAERANGALGFDNNGQPIIMAAAIPQAPPAIGNTLPAPNVTYAVDTSADAQAFGLPALAITNDGSFIEVYDSMNNAATNNITIYASAGDNIYDHGAIASTHTITNSNTITRYTKRNGLWRVVQYGA